MINKIFALPVVEQLTPVLSRRQIDVPISSSLIIRALKPPSRSTAPTCSPGNQKVKKKACG